MALTATGSRTVPVTDSWKEGGLRALPGWVTNSMYNVRAARSISEHKNIAESKCKSHDEVSVHKDGWEDTRIWRPTVGPLSLLDIGAAADKVPQLTDRNNCRKAYREQRDVDTLCRRRGTKLVGRVSR